MVRPAARLAAAPLVEAAWSPGAHCVYIGKAGGDLRRRLLAYRRFGDGRPVSHWGGRYVWQLADASTLLVAWRTVDDGDPAALESELIREFRRHHGRRPLANRKD